MNTNPETPQAAQVLAAVVSTAKDKAVTLETIAARGRRSQDFRARMVACFILREHVQLGPVAIGEAVGRDHSVVCFTVAQAKARLPLYPSLWRHYLRALRVLGMRKMPGMELVGTAVDPDTLQHLRAKAQVKPKGAAPKPPAGQYEKPRWWTPQQRAALRQVQRVNYGAVYAMPTR